MFPRIAANEERTGTSPQGGQHHLHEVNRPGALAVRLAERNAQRFRLVRALERGPDLVPRLGEILADVDAGQREGYVGEHLGLRVGPPIRVRDLDPMIVVLVVRAPVQEEGPRYASISALAGNGVRARAADELEGRWRRRTEESLE